MDKPKATKITLYEDRTTGISSSLKGANIDGIAFNVMLIARKDSDLAIKLLGLYELAKQLEKDA